MKRAPFALQTMKNSYTVTVHKWSCKCMSTSDKSHMHSLFCSLFSKGLPVPLLIKAPRMHNLASVWKKWFLDHKHLSSSQRQTVIDILPKSPEILLRLKMKAFLTSLRRIFSYASANKMKLLRRYSKWASLFDMEVRAQGSDRYSASNGQSDVPNVCGYMRS